MVAGRFGGFPRTSVVGVASEDCLLLETRGSREVTLVSGSGVVRSRLVGARRWKLSPGGGYLVVGRDRLVCLRDGETRRVPDAAKHLQSRAERELELEVQPAVVVRAVGPTREVLAHLRGHFVAAVLRSDGAYLATLGSDGLVVFDWAARTRALVVKQSMIGTVSMGLDGTVAFVRPLEGEVTVMSAALPAAPHDLDEESDRKFARGAVVGPLLQAPGSTAAEERTRARQIAALEVIANDELLTLVRASADRRVGVILEAVSAADSDAELEPLLDDLAAVVGHRGDVFGRRPRQRR